MPLHIERFIPEWSYLDYKGICMYSTENTLVLKAYKKYLDKVYRDPLKVFRIEAAVYDLFGTRPMNIQLVDGRNGYYNNFYWEQVDPDVLKGLPPILNIEGSTEFYPNKIRVGPASVYATNEFITYLRHYREAFRACGTIYLAQDFAKEVL